MTAQLLGLLVLNSLFLVAGGAVVWAACCDLRLAADSAWFSIPEVDLNLPMTWNSLPRLMRELGPARYAISIRR